MIVDAHTHVVPEALPFGLGGDPRWPEVHRQGDGGDVVIAGRVFRHVDSVAWSPDARLAAMDADGVDVHVVSPMPELFSYWAPPHDAARFCRHLNAWLASFVDASPGRLFGLGIVPLQDLDLAVEALGTLPALGLRGVAVGTHVEGVSIADARFLPFWDALAHHDLAGFVHAFHPERFTAFPPRIANAVTFPWEIGYATSALIARATPLQVPGLRLAVSHGGGGAIPTLPRLIDAWESDESVREHLPEHPLDVAKRLYYDSLVFDPRVLDLVADFVGPDRLVLGSDFPFMRTPCHHVLTRSRMSVDAKHLAASENVPRWLGLGQPPDSGVRADA